MRKQMKPKVRKTGKSSVAAKNQNAIGKLSWRRVVDEGKVAEVFDKIYGERDPKEFQSGKRYTIKY